MTHRELPRWKKILYTLLALIVLAAVIVAIFLLRDRQPAAPPPIPSPTPSETPRGLSNEKFGSRARQLSTANVDVGILTVRKQSSPTPRAAGRNLTALGPIAQLTPYSPMSPSPTPEAGSLQSVPTALPSAAPALEPLPSFTPLPDAPAPGEREFAIVYAKGSIGKRQVYLRSVERDEDEQLVSSVFDDYGVAFGSSTQKVAFYSNEEGASDQSTKRSKLKVVDIASRKVTTIAEDLPGTWPAVWSPDGKKLAIPANRAIFVADITTGKSVRIKTSQPPGGIAWLPTGISLLYQVEVADGNNNILLANVITGQSKPVAVTPANEHDASVSVDGGKVAFLRAEGVGGDALVVMPLEDKLPHSFRETQPASSYLMNRTFTETVLVRGGRQPRLALFTDGIVKQIGKLRNPVLVGWDRDYEHVLVLADDDRSRALFSVEIATGDAQKLKAGISDSVPVSER